jgi:hypothetical protein
MLMSKSITLLLIGAAVTHASFDKLGLYEPGSLVTDHVSADIPFHGGYLVSVKNTSNCMFFVE